MKSPGSLVFKFILYLVLLGIGTFVLFFLFEIIAIPIAPVQTILACPPETTINYTFAQQSWDQPGQKTMGKTCMDQAGKAHQALSDEIYNQRQFNLFLPLGFISMAVIELIWILVGLLRKKSKT